MTTPMSCSISTIVMPRSWLMSAMKRTARPSRPRSCPPSARRAAGSLAARPERAREFDPLLQAVRQLPDDRLAIRRDMQEIQDFLGPLRGTPRSAAVPPQPERDGSRNGAAAVARQAGQHVLEHAQALELARCSERCARCPAARPPSARTAEAPRRRTRCAPEFGHRRR